MRKLSFGQNQGIVWFSDSNLWGNQLLRCQKLSFGQNQGIVWSSDSNLWGNQLLRWENWVLDRTKVLYGPRTQTYGKTNYSSKSSFGQNQGIPWSSDSNLWKGRLLNKNFKLLNPQLKYQKKVKAMKVVRKMAKHSITQQPGGAVHFWVICLRMITSYTAPSIQ